MKLTAASLGALLLCAVALLPACTTGVDPSPSPGIVRVMLKASESDTMIVIQNDSSRFSRWDNFYLTISQGRLYRGENYAPIYADPGIGRPTGDTVNILARQWLDGRPITTADADAITPANSRYRQFKIFESYVPPGTYDRLQFALLATEMQIFVPKNYSNPVQLPPDQNLLVDFPASITVNEKGVTQVNIEMQPFKSLHRYRDSFLFDRKMQIVTVQHL